MDQSPAHPDRDLLVAFSFGCAVVAVLVPILAITDAPDVVRVPLTLIFFLLVPGAAVGLRLSRLAPLERLAVAIAGSILVGLAGGLLQVLLELWNPNAWVAGVGALSAVAHMQFGLARISSSRKRAEGTLASRPT